MCQFTPPEILILVAVAIGAVTDITTKKIYNEITMPTALGGLFLNSVHYSKVAGWGISWSGAAWSIAGCCLALAITILPRIRKGEDALKMGDVKIWMAVGACLLPIKMLICWFYFSLTFGAISIFLIGKSIPLDQIKGFWLAVHSFFTSGVDLSSTVDTTEVDAARKALIPVCPAIAIGTLLGILFDKPLMHFMGFNWY